MSKIVIDDKDTGIDHADEGPWRGYHLTTEGTSLADLEANASITEVDQDGGDLNTYALGDARRDVYERGCQMIETAIDDYIAALRDRSYQIDQAIDESKGS